MRRTASVALAGLALLAFTAAADGDAPPGWQPIGRAAGVEAYSARTPVGTVRIRFHNTNRHAVSIRVDRTVVWCGSRRRGEGEPVRTDVGPFELGPEQGRSNPAWNAPCDKPDYFVEFRGIAIEAGK